MSTAVKHHPASTEGIVSVDVVEDVDGIPTARVVCYGDTTTGQTRFQASQALAAYRLEQLKPPFPGALQLVGYGRTTGGRWVMEYRPERIL